ncbi:MAG: hypothetical protein IT580_05620, partial [Verrucomicrobiales bacterium]|nr:hypothetical protein [Verrucomicrobiales bacterium]
LGQGYFGLEGGDSHGGALSAASLTLQILDSRFTRNSSIGGTGGHPSLLGSPSTGGSGGDAIGGAIDLRPGGTSSIHRCVISENTARGGTGGYGKSPGLGAPANGGGLASRFRDLVVTASSLNANQATSGRFGGAGSWTPANYYVTRGGGASIDAGSAVFINSTFSGNHVAQLDFSPDSRGGGLSQNSAGASVRLQFCTLVSNIVTRVVGIGPNTESPRSRGTGLWCPTNATVTLESTVIAANLPGTAGDLVGRVTSTGPNLIGDAREALGLADHDRSGLDPKLGPLSDFGDGLLVHTPLLGSPLLDAATEVTSPATDQLGRPRVSGAAADLGAVEWQVPLAPLSSPRLSLLPSTSAAALRLFILAPAEADLVLEESTDLAAWSERGRYHHGDSVDLPLTPTRGFFRLRRVN